MVNWIALAPPGWLGIMAHPRLGDLKHLRSKGVDVLVSMLDVSEARSLGLADEESCAAAEGLRFVWHPIVDLWLPADEKQFLECVESLSKQLDSGASIAIHCRAGIGRSSMLAACLLAKRGHSAAAAFDLISAARGRPVPDTPDQRAWTERFIATHVVT